MTPFHWLALALTLIQAWDGWTTYHVIKLGGRETNPLLLWLLRLLMKLIPDERKARYAMLLFAKVGAAALAWFLAIVPIAHQAQDDIRMGLMGALTVLYVVIAANNYNVLCKLKERR